MVQERGTAAVTASWGLSWNSQSGEGSTTAVHRMVPRSQVVLGACSIGLSAYRRQADSRQPHPSWEQPSFTEVVHATSKHGHQQSDKKLSKPRVRSTHPAAREREIESPIVTVLYFVSAPIQVETKPNVVQDRGTAAVTASWGLSWNSQSE